ncbi:MAG: glycosyltransferase [Pseudomonadota bacterium]
MNLHKWIISGVGRSGTTFLYGALQALAERMGLGAHTVYEPYLWGPRVWNRKPAEIAPRFASTSALHLKGIYTHLETPLFCSQRTRLHDSFLADVLLPNRHALVKVIRAAGRLDLFLEHDPGIKIVHLIRNPLDVVNSAAAMFSFFGGEVHPTDETRFARSVAERFPETAAVSLDSEASASFEWWRRMNDAAIDTAKRKPRRVLLVPHEALAADRQATFLEIVRFLGADGGLAASIDLKAQVGPVSQSINLHRDDIALLRPHLSEYLSEVETLAPASLPFDRAEAERSIEKRYIGPLQDGEFVRPVEPTRISIDLREEILRLRYLVHDLRNEVTALKQSRRDMQADYDAALARKDDVIQSLHNQYGALESERTGYAVHHAAKVAERARDVRDAAHDLSRSRALKVAGPAFRALRRQVGVVQAHAQVMSDSLDVTCVITNYEGAGTIANAVLSAVGQSRPLKKILVVDDGSSDGSADVIRALENEHPAVEAVIREKTLGVAVNRHLALLSAETAIVTHFDGDDTITPGKVEAEVAALGGRLDRVAYSDYIVRRTDGVEKADLSAFAGLTTPAERINHVLLRRSAFPRDMTLSKALYTKAGGYDPAARMYEDWTFKMQLARDADDWVRAGGTGLIHNSFSDDATVSAPEAHWYWRAYAVAQNYDWLTDWTSTDDLISVVSGLSVFIEAASQKAAYESAVGRAAAARTPIDIIGRALAPLARRKRDVTAVVGATDEIINFTTRIEEQLSAS